MVSMLQMRLPFTITALPGPGLVRHPLLSHRITRFCASVSLCMAIYFELG